MVQKYICTIAKKKVIRKRCIQSETKQAHKNTKKVSCETLPVGYQLFIHYN